MGEKRGIPQGDGWEQDRVQRQRFEVLEPRRFQPASSSERAPVTGRRLTMVCIRHLQAVATMPDFSLLASLSLSIQTMAI